jgi:hypothetical protein
MVGTAGIAAEKYLHVKYFPNSSAYDDFNDVAVYISEVGVDSFATLIQEILVYYLREKHGNKVADWCRYFWTGERGRMCLAHSRYAGCNNNMGVEVSWRQIKRVCPNLASLTEFIGALCKVIRRQLGEEHGDRLLKEGACNAFIRNPTATKHMYDVVQDVHPKTLSACFVMTTCNSKAHPDVLFRDMAGCGRLWRAEAVELQSRHCISRSSRITTTVSVMVPPCHSSCFDGSRCSCPGSGSSRSWIERESSQSLNCWTCCDSICWRTGPSS